jgi:glucose-6-phosphate isomerase, archaeal
MSTTVLAPFALSLDLESGELEPYTTRIERRLSSLRGAFADEGAFAARVDSGDPLVYEVEQYDVPEETGQLICCTTVIQPGTVGGELFMTKGHFHADRDTGEVYVGLRGRGYLLLATEAGEHAELPMERGTVAYVPPRWAHRTVNTSNEPFAFLAVYPAQAGHDYGSIESTGFPQRVFMTDAGTEVRR